ncbi:MAG: DUF4331 family protein [Bacteroidia bacterium]
MTKVTQKGLRVSFVLAAVAALSFIGVKTLLVNASSHREAPLIANDPQADNTDLYAFRTPDDTNTVTLIACYSPGELPQGGPNYYSFGEGIRYEIHVKNNAATEGDDICYRFTFTNTNQDPTTFFNIRLGAENLKTTYTCKRSTNGDPFVTIISNGVVPPNNIGPRSINSTVGLHTTYDALWANAITTAATGETVFCGPTDDPFFVDLGGIFDLGQTRQGQTGKAGPRDGLSCKNVHAICLKVPISTLQKDKKDVTMAANILDPEFVIGVYASASRPQITTLSNNGGKPTRSGKFVQVSRLGMPLTNEVVIPIGDKDYWNAVKPFNEPAAFGNYLCNPELALYMDDSQFGGAIPALSDLRIQTNSLGAFDFRNGHDGLYSLKGTSAVTGTALDDAIFGTILLQPNKPRSVDLLPIFMTGVPNLRPYQLATGKNGDPLAAGKPFINNFLPTLGDMLRLNMAVPVTQRNDPKFSSLGLLYAAVLGLTDPAYNTNSNIQFIPNMDGFPNGRRLEDDVTRIELQAVSGIVLSVLGLWYDDFTVGGNPVTPDLLSVLNYTTGVEHNDLPFLASWPYLAKPRSGFGGCGGALVDQSSAMYQSNSTTLKIGAPDVILSQNYPNPAVESTTFKYRVAAPSSITINILNETGDVIATPVSNQNKMSGTYEVNYDVRKLSNGVYFAQIKNNDVTVQVLKFTVAK